MEQRPRVTINEYDYSANWKLRKVGNNTTGWNTNWNPDNPVDTENVYLTELEKTKATLNNLLFDDYNMPFNPEDSVDDIIDKIDQALNGPINRQHSFTWTSYIRTSKFEQADVDSVPTNMLLQLVETPRTVKNPYVLDNSKKVFLWKCPNSASFHKKITVPEDLSDITINLTIQGTYRWADCRCDNVIFGIYDNTAGASKWVNKINIIKISDNVFGTFNINYNYTFTPEEGHTYAFRSIAEQFDLPIYFYNFTITDNTTSSVILDCSSNESFLQWFPKASYPQPEQYFSYFSYTPKFFTDEYYPHVVALTNNYVYYEDLYGYGFYGNIPLSSIYDSVNKQIKLDLSKLPVVPRPGFWNTYPTTPNFYLQFAEFGDYYVTYLNGTEGSSPSNITDCGNVVYVNKTFSNSNIKGKSSVLFKGCMFNNRVNIDVDPGYCVVFDSCEFNISFYTVQKLITISKYSTVKFKSCSITIDFWSAQDRWNRYETWDYFFQNDGRCVFENCGILTGAMGYFGVLTNVSVAGEQIPVPIKTITQSSDCGFTDGLPNKISYTPFESSPYMYIDKDGYNDPGSLKMLGNGNSVYFGLFKLDSYKEDPYAILDFDVKLTGTGKLRILVSNYYSTYSINSINYKKAFDYTDIELSGNDWQHVTVSVNFTNTLNVVHNSTISLSASKYNYTYLCFEGDIGSYVNIDHLGITETSSYPSRIFSGYVTNSNDYGLGPNGSFCNLLVNGRFQNIDQLNAKYVDTVIVSRVSK